MARTFPRLFRAAANLHPSPVDLSMIMDPRITQILTAGDQGIEPRCDDPESSALPLSQSPNRCLPSCRLGPKRGPLASSSNSILSQFIWWARRESNAARRFKRALLRLGATSPSFPLAAVLAVVRLHLILLLCFDQCPGEGVEMNSLLHLFVTALSDTPSS
jgi:hypothetical protein